MKTVSPLLALCFLALLAAGGCAKVEAPASSDDKLQERLGLESARIRSLEDRVKRSEEEIPAAEV